jgi:hypothetical protein
MIDYIVKNKAKLSPNYLILVLDEFSTKIISNYCELWDLMQNGNIYQIERQDILCLMLSTLFIPQVEALIRF